MQPVSDQAQQTITQVFTTFLSLMTQDVQALIDLYVEDAVVEFPYAFDTPRRLEGKKAIYNYLKDALAQMQNLRFINIHVYPTTDPNILWAEVQGEAVIAATGLPYQQEYVMRLETRNGQIAHYREYWNPTIVIEEWANTQDWLQALNVEDAA
jgi:ketosteroid isomerase-like protein